MPGPPTAIATFHLVDEARAEPRLGPSAKRPISLQLVYPAASEAVHGPRIAERAAILEATASWPDQEPHVLAETYGPLPAAGAKGAAPADGRFPLVLLSPGGYQSRHHYAGLARALSGAGYVVALLSHAFAGLDHFPTHGLLGRHPSWSAPDADRLEEMTDCLAADASFALDRILDGPLAPTVDAGRVAILGHSRGGRTVSRAASADPRLTAAVIYDALPPQRERAAGFHQPLLMLRVGDPENDTHWRNGTGRWPKERIDAARALVATSRAPAYDIAIPGIGHMNFSDRALVEPERFPSRLGASLATEIICTTTLAFLDRHLKGKPEADVAAVALALTRSASSAD
jgi:predicted dienelactone hydrolase